MHEYIDKCKSATTDKRPEFQRMIEDAKKNKFSAVIIHKYDRFSRNMADTLHYVNELKRHSVKLISVADGGDDTPNGEFMNMITQVMADYYSKNLAFEVEKGKKENAYKGIHVGGRPPLGYDIDPTTKKLVINEREAESVKIIFDMCLNGFGYSEIIYELNEQGYKTKLGNEFVKNSITEILRNEKYAGTFVYGKTAPKDCDGKINRHKYNDDSKIIRTENTHPAIVSKADFDTIQNKKSQRKKRAGSFTAKETYLLSGKIFCGECGSPFSGINRNATAKCKQYISYRCSKRNRTRLEKCHNSEIRRENIELLVLERLSDYLFTDEIIQKILDKRNDVIKMKKNQALVEIEKLEKRLENLNCDIISLVNLMIKTQSLAMAEKLEAMEKEKSELEDRHTDLYDKAGKRLIPKAQYKRAFSEAKKRLANGKLNVTKKIIETYVNKVVVFKDKIQIQFDLGTEEFQPFNEKIPQNIPRQSDDSTVFNSDSTNNKIDTFNGRGGDTELF